MWEAPTPSVRLNAGNCRTLRSRILSEIFDAWGPDPGPVQLGNSITLGKNTKVIGPVAIGPGTTIGDNVLIGPYTSIGDKCIIRNNVKIFSSSLYNRVIVGTNSTISGCIMDNDTHIGESLQYRE